MNEDELLKRLYDEYKDEEKIVDKIKNLIGQLNGLGDPEKIRPILEELQQETNVLSNTQVTSTLIELQVIINSYRYKYDITDPREVINWDNGRGFVQ